ncbi:MAG: M23 family metallopeptidase [bacterium]|nr:M23 family metallopeptidase [bacterium]
MPFIRLCKRIFVLPIYGAFVLLKLRIRRFSLPTRGVALFLVGNRYLFHAVLVLTAVATISVNLRTPSVHAQDVGRGSLLYALATQSALEIIEEDSRDETITPTVSYFSAETIQATPHIDFDYEDHDDTITSLSVPGAIKAPPTYSPDGESQAPRTKVETYVVQEGDTIGSIAREFRVNVGTILWSNNLTEREYIRPGNSLKIPPVSGVLVTVKSGDTLARLASRYDVEKAEIISFNKLRDDSTLSIGTELMLPGGTPPAVVQRVTIAKGRSAEVAPTNIQRPASATQVGGNALLWPTPGHVITQYYGWSHTGLDIDGDLSSPLYASEDGIVTTAGWNSGGYGLQILMKHSNGIVTRYAHASKLFVKVGDVVQRGNVIAMMGSTGRSTGSHLHFEVYVAGRRVNPLPYIR